MKKRAYKRVFDGLATVEKWFIAFLLAVDILLTAANVLSRYVLHNNWSFTEEIVVAILVLMSMIGAALCARTRGGLINLTMVTDRLPKRVQVIMDIITTILLLAFSFALVKYGFERCMSMAAGGQMTQSLQIPEWIYNAFVPLGGVLLIIHGVEHTVDCIFELADEKHAAADAAAEKEENR